MILINFIIHKKTKINNNNITDLNIDHFSSFNNFNQNDLKFLNQTGINLF
jgi:hypothetical protein